MARQHAYNEDMVTKQASRFRGASQQNKWMIRIVLGQSIPAFGFTY